MFSLARSLLLVSSIYRASRQKESWIPPDLSFLVWSHSRQGLLLGGFALGGGGFFEGFVQGGDVGGALDAFAVYQLPRRPHEHQPTQVDHTRRSQKSPIRLTVPTSLAKSSGLS